jgi:Transposase domain (DUF772)
MAQNFIACDREKELLLPPSLREWLPEEHLAWFVLDAVEEMDLAAFYAAYRADGHGRAAHDPAMIVALLLYAYAVGERSSRAIERRCLEDIALPGIAAFRPLRLLRLCMGCDHLAGGRGPSGSRMPSKKGPPVSRCLRRCGSRARRCRRGPPAPSGMPRSRMPRRPVQSCRTRSERRVA